MFSLLSVWEIEAQKRKITPVTAPDWNGCQPSALPIMSLCALKGTNLTVTSIKHAARIKRAAKPAKIFIKEMHGIQEEENYYLQ